MSDADLISVIMPAYNAARFIGQALASVLAQTHRDIEVIVVDDGSTDTTAAVIHDIARADSRVRLVRTPRRGVSAARNLAIAQARGDWIAPIDADDLWRPDKLARQLAVTRAGGDRLGLVYCWCAAIDEDGAIILSDWSRGEASGSVLHEVIARGLVGNGSTPLIRRACLDAVGGYDPDLRLGEDWKLYIALAAICDFAVVPDHLVGYRFSAQHASLDRDWERALDEVTHWIRRSWPRLPSTVIRERAYHVGAFLAFLAIRRRDYVNALLHQAAAFVARPDRIVSMAWIDFWSLWIGHVIGIRRYSWALGRPPRQFLLPLADASAADRTGPPDTGP